MRNISAKADGIGDTLPASDFNANLRSELQNVVTSSDQTLDAEGGPDTDVEMLGKAITIYSNASQYYQDSGAANSYVLARVGNLKPLVDYIDGTIVVFKAGNTNTGASTANIDSLGSKDIRDSYDNALVGGEILAGRYIIIRYNSANDRFEMIGLVNQTTQYLTASGSYVKPDGMRYCVVTVVGGGGGGGASVGTTVGPCAGAAGGGAGGYTKKLYLNSDLSASEAYTIGAAGAGGTGGAGGGSGGTSTFKGLSSTGGSGGEPGSETSGQTFELGGPGGIGSGGDINALGGSGDLGIGTNTLSGVGGAGGDSILSGGGAMNRTSGNANGNVGFYGSGGSGAVSGSGSTTNSQGGNGGAGIIIVEEFF